MYEKISLEIETKANKTGIEELGWELKTASESWTDDLSKTWDKSWSSMIDKSGKSISSGIGQSLCDGVTTGFDNISGVWDSAWTSLAKSAKNILSDGLGSLALGSLGLSSGGKGLTDAISDSLAAYNMGDSLSEALVAGGC